MGTTRMFSGAGCDGHGEVPGLYSGRDERPLKLYLWWMRVLCNCCVWWQDESNFNAYIFTECFLRTRRRP